MNYYTSLETSKQLKAWGCELESEQAYTDNGRGSSISPLMAHTSQADILNLGILAPAYHLLEDVCVKYAKEFFGEEHIYFAKEGHAFEILYLLQKNKKEEAEKYLLEHTIFNPKNK